MRIGAETGPVNGPEIKYHFVLVQQRQYTWKTLVQQRQYTWKTLVQQRQYTWKTLVQQRQYTSLFL